MKLDFENRDPAACCIPKQATWLFSASASSKF
jgi:hypothetical protein